MSKGAVWLIVLLIILGLAVVGSGGTFLYFKYVKNNLNANSSNVNQNTNSSTADFETYSNSEYSFSFQYPSAWKSTKKEITTLPGPASSDFLFGVSFYDPIEKKKIDCANANYQNTWEGANVTQAECQPVLSKMSVTEKEKYSGPRAAADIYAYIFKKDNTISLSDWLIKTYRVENTELQDYSPGKEITIDSENGYLSSIGCCSESNRSYVVNHRDYTFSVGTTYFDNQLGEKEMPQIFTKIINTFKFSG